MQLNDLIRYYQQFPAVIPVPQASSLRVTHPSAMVTMVQAPLPHRLACVKHSVSVHPEPGSNSSFNIFLIYFISTLVLTSFLPSRQVLLTFICILHIVASSILIFYCPAILFRIDKIYIIISPPLCQLLFSIFLIFFHTCVIQSNTTPITY